MGDVPGKLVASVLDVFCSRRSQLKPTNIAYFFQNIGFRFTNFRFWLAKLVIDNVALLPNADFGSLNS